MIFALLAGWSLAAAVICGLRWLSPPLVPLGLLAGLDKQGTPVRRERGHAPKHRLHDYEVQLGTWMVALLSRRGISASSTRRGKDLAAAELSLEEHWGTKVALSVLAPMIVLTPRLVFWVLGASLSTDGLFLPCAGAAAFGYFAPELRLRRLARQRRAEFAAALGFIARLARIAVAGGDGPESAARRACQFGDGWAHSRLRRALTEYHGQPMQVALYSLGRELGIPEAEQLADVLAVARKKGSPLLEALAASARGIHGDRLHAAEAAEARKSVLLSLPMGLMVLGLIVVFVSGIVAQILELFVQ
ncbi:MAG: tight adherence protein [Actinomycetota bacterium]|jgi:Flp pilus assembly protein TadB|nr:tight adherence protein [Actinomycetota bacterium]